MKIEKYEKIGKGKYRLYLDNGEVLDTYDEVILKNNLLQQKIITPTVYTKILEESELQEHYNSCVKYITVRLRSTKEIEDYLKRKKVPSQSINTIICRLSNAQLLNDDYFCECFMKDKLRFTSMGEYRIINELKKHNISTEIIEKHHDIINEKIMREKIEKIIEKQIASNHKLIPSKLRNKLYNHLINLGYSSALVTELLNKKF